MTVDTGDVLEVEDAPLGTMEPAHRPRFFGRSFSGGGDGRSSVLYAFVAGRRWPSITRPACRGPDVFGHLLETARWARQRSVAPAGNHVAQVRPRFSAGARPDHPLKGQRGLARRGMRWNHGTGGAEAGATQRRGVSAIALCYPNLTGFFENCAIAHSKSSGYWQPWTRIRPWRWRADWCSTRSVPSVVPC